MSITKERPGNMLFVCVTVGLVLLASKYRDNVFRGVKQICHSLTQYNKEEKKSRDNIKNHKEINNDNIILADSLEKCDVAVENIRNNLQDGVLGFDCEWVKEGPVSLVQLATNNGVCALFRIEKIGYVPNNLKELLTNRKFLKVGVATFEDGKKLSNDFGCQVSGTVDLRTLASRFNLPCPKSLAALCMRYLDMEMDKIMEVQCSDWKAPDLSPEQISYAAFNAYASVLIYHQIMLESKRKLSFLDTVVVYIKNTWNDDEDERYHALPHGIIDERFFTLRDSNTVNVKKIKQDTPTTNVVEICDAPLSSKQLPTRHKPLYHNCLLMAPDGEILCTCDRKKAEWYIKKELGVVQSEEPFTVKLKFEPSGRAQGEVGQYYTQEKVNQCVVCGSKDEFLRKNVVPREYRKHFPPVMKAHQSHDIVLLCPKCHEVSNAFDLQLRKWLAYQCNAPMSNQKPKIKKSLSYEGYENAVKLFQNNYVTSQKKYLDHEFYKGYNYNNYEKIATNEQFKLTHGRKVVEYFKLSQNGLVELEKLWRQHFLKNMKPQYLPKLWSVDHNVDRLKLRQKENRIKPADAIVAGLNSVV